MRFVRLLSGGFVDSCLRVHLRKIPINIVVEQRNGFAPISALQLVWVLLSDSRFRCLQHSFRLESRRPFIDRLMKTHEMGVIRRAFVLLLSHCFLLSFGCALFSIAFIL